MSWGFEIGRIYHRRNDIHARFGGQQQGGIVTPGSFSLIILITGQSSDAFGYHDRLRDDGIFEYFGEGLSGDMSFTRGNGAILNHSQAGKSLLLFEKVKDGLRYLGEYVCEGYRTAISDDIQGNSRNAIVFELKPLDALNEALEGEPLSKHAGDIRSLRQSAYNAATIAPEKKSILVTAFQRAVMVRAYVLARAAGMCEYCGNPAPFMTANNQPFLEAHHIRRMSDGGPDHPLYVAGLCPNCHRAAHYSSDAEQINRELLDLVKLRERDLG